MNWFSAYLIGVMVFGSIMAKVFADRWRDTADDVREHLTLVIFGYAALAILWPVWLILSIVIMTGEDPRKNRK